MLLNIPIIAGFALGAVLASTVGVVNGFSMDRARDSLVAARGAFDRLVETRAANVARELPHQDRRRWACRRVAAVRAALICLV